MPFKTETHAHTSVVSPCGKLSTRELRDMYLAAGYTTIVTTDHLVDWLPLFRGVRSWRDRVHRFFSGYRELAAACSGTGLVVLPGFELTYPGLPGRDFLVFGIDEPTLAELPNICRLDPASFRPVAEDAGALVFQAHPYRGCEPVDPSLIDGIEVFNGNPRHDSRNDLAAAFADRHDLLRISGSDAHQREDVGCGGIVTPEPIRTVPDLIRWLRDDPGQIELIGAERSVTSITVAIGSARP